MLKLLTVSIPQQSQRADEDAAKLYESFVESFEVEQRAPQHGGGSNDGGFVRGGVVMPGQSPSARELGGCQGMQHGCWCNFM